MYDGLRGGRGGALSGGRTEEGPKGFATSAFGFGLGFGFCDGEDSRLINGVLEAFSGVLNIGWIGVLLKP